MLIIIFDMEAFLCRRIFHGCGVTVKLMIWLFMYSCLSAQHFVWDSHGVVLLVPGHNLLWPHPAPRQNYGDLVILLLGDLHLPPDQLGALALSTNHHHFRQVGAEQTRVEIFPVGGGSWHQILGINLESNSISKNNISNVKAFPRKGDYEKRNNLKHLVWIPALKKFCW